MQRNARRAVVLVVPFVLAAFGQACGGDDQPPSGSSNNGLDSGKSDATQATDGASSDDGGGGNKDGTADAIVDAPPTDAPFDAGSPTCDPAGNWGSGAPVLTTVAADSAIFGSITPDEITMAWTTVTGGVATVWYADRPAKAMPFGTPFTLDAMFGTVAADRVSVSQDGLRIVGISSNGAGFVTATRMNRGTAFDSDNPNEFTPLLPGPDSDAAPPSFAAPLYAPSDQWFLYLLTSSTDDHVLIQSRGAPWLPGAGLGPNQVMRENGMLRRPTGLSTDDRTLFYWDEVTGSEKAAWRPTPTALFDHFVDLGARRNAAPTGACQRLYYSVPGDGGTGAITIVVADKQ